MCTIKLIKWLFIFVLIFSSLDSYLLAQTSAITATITDSDSQAWAGMKWRVTFVPNPSYPNLNNYVIAATGAPINRSIANPDPGIADGTGTFSVTVYDNTAIQPAGSSYTFTLCAKTVAPCSVIPNISVNGATEDLSSTLSSLVIAPRFAAVSGAYGYNDTEVSPTPLPGGRYFNVTDQTTHEWNGTVWQTTSGSGTVSGVTSDCTGTGTGVIPIICTKTGGVVFAPSATTDTTNAGNISTGTVTRPVAVPIGGTSVTAPNIGGLGYAKLFGNGSTNGISTCFGTYASCIADPSYATTEHYSWNFNNSALPFTMSPSAASALDYRTGKFARTYHNSPVDPFSTYYAAERINCGQDLTSTPPSGSTQFHCLDMFELISAPGLDHGNQPVGQQGWSTHQTININKTTVSSGISSMLTGSHTKAGIGDNEGVQIYNFNYGGAVAQSDEGNHIFSGNGGEAGTTYAGTVTSGGAGATTVKVTCTADCNDPGDGRYLIDTHSAVLTGNITAQTTPVSFTPGNFTFDTSAPISTFWGTLSSNCNAGAGPIPPGTGYNTVTCTVASGPGNTGAPVANDLLCFAGQFHEQAKITSVTGSGPWSITLPLRQPHEASSWVMANSICGDFIDPTANQVTTSQLLRYPVDMLGCTTATTCQYRWFERGNSGQTFRTGNMVIGTQAATSLTNTGGITTFSAGNDDWYVGNSVTFTSAANSAFNGTCTNVFKTPNLNGASNYGCGQAGLSGQTSATANVAVGTSGFGNTAFTLWPGGEVLDAMDRSVAPAIIDGTFTLEANPAAWANGDTVENVHHYALDADAGQYSLAYLNPVGGPISTHIFRLACTGGGCNGIGPVSTNSLSLIRLDNVAPITTYLGHGGYVTPPGGIYEGNSGGSGLFNYALAMQFAPDGPSPSVVNVGAPATGVTDCTQKYTIFQLTGSANGNLLYTPCHNELSFAGNVNVVLNSDLGFTQFRDSIRFAALATPVSAVPTCVTTGGTIADSTQVCSVVEAVNNAGHSSPSVETCATTGSSGSNTNKCTYSWSYVIGAASYKNYCRTTSAELFCQTLNGTNTTSWVDNGTVTPSGAIPAGNTSLGGVNSASQLQLQGSTSALNVTIKANASQATSTMTLPSLPCAANQTWSDNGSGVYSCASLSTFYPAQTATCTPGTNVTSCTCATATCTSNRGSYTIVGGTATTGTIATLSWTAVAAAPVCTTSENGGVGFLGIGHSVATTTGMNITAGVAVTGLTITVDYSCVP
jgi:hypothetical protein